MANVKFLFAAFMLLSCVACGSRVGYLVHEPVAQEPGSSKQTLAGSFSTTDDRTIDLAQDNGLPTVLIFSNDSCITCAAETAAIRSSLKNPDQGPSKIHLYTVLNGAIKDDAVYWKNLRHVSWDVGYDENSVLFMKHCPDHTKIPCTIVQVPGKGIVLVHQGQADLASIVSLTGPWE